MKRVSIHQPHYLPWLGLCDKIFKSDAFVLLDHVQFMSRGFQHRSLYSNVRKASYLTLSVDDADCQTNRTPIRDIPLKEPRVVLDKHIQLLRARYKKARNVALMYRFIDEVLARPWLHLADLASATMRFTLDAFEATPEWAVSSELPVSASKSALMLELTMQVGGGAYLSGRGAEAYMEEAPFSAQGIRLEYQSFVHPTYPQGFDGEFVPGCFALELAFLDPGFIDTLRAFYRDTEQLSELRCVAWA